MRPEVWKVVTSTTPVVLVTGDTGTGKSSVVHASIPEYPGTVLAPSVEVCLFDSGALQSALLDAISTALAAAQLGQKRWPAFSKRLRTAMRESAIEMGKGLAKAVVEEVVELAKSRLGQNVGQGLLKFLKTLKENDTDALRRTLRAQSDGNVARLLVRLADEVASAANRDIVITLDEGNRLSGDDQRILSSIAAKPPKRVRVVVAWSAASADSLPGLATLRRLGMAEVEVGGLSRDDVGRWLHSCGQGAHTEEVYALTAGYPLLVEGLVGQLRSGGGIGGYTAPTVFNDVLHDALRRLPVEAHQAARRLSAFAYPPPEGDIPDLLGIDAVAWGVIRTALESEHVFSVHYPEGKWFHEARRTYLWERVLTTPERNQVGQLTYSRLRTYQESGGASVLGVLRQLAELAPFAVDSQADNPMLTTILHLDADQLAVVAAAIELQNTGPSSSPTPADQVVIHAHTAFGCDRRRALDVMPGLIDLGILATGDVPHSDIDRVETVVDLDVDDECDLVVRGRIQEVLGMAAVPHLADHVVRAHLDQFRLESYAVVTQAGVADAVDVIANANLVRAPVAIRRIGDPLLGVWLRFGDQPVTVVGVFNNTGDRSAAEREVAQLTGSSFGRSIQVARTFKDPTHTIPSQRFIRAVYFATGIQLNATRDGRQYWLRNASALPMEEFAQRQVDLLELLRSNTDELEREIYGLTEPRGIAITRQGNTEYSLEVIGAAHVYPMDAAVVEDILSQRDFISARLELALDLPPQMTTKHLTTQTWTGERDQDPVVELLARLRNRAADFNFRQPRTEVPLEGHRLIGQLAAAHLRDQRFARTMSEVITVGGQRGIRPPRALRIAIHTHGRADQPAQRAAVCAWPPGDPEDVQVKYVADESANSPEDIYRAAFGAESDMTDLHSGMLRQILAASLGFGENEIEVVA